MIKIAGRVVSTFGAFLFILLPRLSMRRQDGLKQTRHTGNFTGMKLPRKLPDNLGLLFLDIPVKPRVLIQVFYPFRQLEVNNRASWSDSRIFLTHSYVPLMFYLLLSSSIVKPQMLHTVYITAYIITSVASTKLFSSEGRCLVSL